jgi:hypothetical protein
MTLHFSFLMLLGLGMIPGGILLGYLLAALLAMRGLGMGAFSGFIPGIAIAIAGIAVFLVGLGMELR